MRLSYKQYLEKVKACWLEKTSNAIQTALYN